LKWLHICHAVCNIYEGVCESWALSGISDILDAILAQKMLIYIAADRPYLPISILPPDQVALATPRYLHTHCFP